MSQSNSAKLSRDLASHQPRQLRVLLGDRLVGRLAETSEGLTAFEYDTTWLAEGFSISPLSLPLESRVFIPTYTPFEGLWGVFNDSLPDGWGRLLLDRLLRRQGLDPELISPLTRLAIIGATGMGALRYEPDITLEEEPAQSSSLDVLAHEALQMLRTDDTRNLDELFIKGGSSGGARPKILTCFEGEDWIIKFPAAIDPTNIGEQEYRYALVAQSCGIEMPEVRLFPSQRCSGYFGVRRFDREPGPGETTRCLHVASVSALLETSHRIPSLDYVVLMRLTLEVTKSFEELERLYRLMCFNVFAHNRDDHAKNFAFIYHPEQAVWRLSPAFDLTYSRGMGGEHATTVNGKGRDITLNDLVGLATRMGLPQGRSKEIAGMIQEKAAPLL